MGRSKKKPKPYRKQSESNQPKDGSCIFVKLDKGVWWPGYASEGKGYFYDEDEYNITLNKSNWKYTVSDEQLRKSLDKLKGRNKRKFFDDLEATKSKKGSGMTGHADGQEEIVDDNIDEQERLEENSKVDDDQEKILEDGQMKDDDQEKIVKDGQMKDDDHEKIVKDGQMMDDDQEKIVKDGQMMDDDHEKIVKDGQMMDDDQEKIVKDGQMKDDDQEKIVKDGQMVDDDQEKIVKDGQMMGDDQEKIVKDGQMKEDDQEKIVDDGQMIDDDQEKIVKAGQMIDDDQEKIVKDGQMKDDDQEKIVKDGQMMDDDQEKIVKDGKMMDDDQEKIMKDDDQEMLDDELERRSDDELERISNDELEWRSDDELERISNDELEWRSDDELESITLTDGHDGNMSFRYDGNMVMLKENREAFSAVKEKPDLEQVMDSCSEDSNCSLIWPILSVSLRKTRILKRWQTNDSHKDSDSSVHDYDSDSRDPSYKPQKPDRLDDGETDASDHNDSSALTITKKRKSLHWKKKERKKTGCPGPKLTLKSLSAYFIHVLHQISLQQKMMFY
ncbi:titin homolog [Pecten maximus]|uniref:titin homolog n=1 Tax=Pecten maximus TaxID=6579 RepID=UPI001458F947|nr:titin homolog [Pecten maximus]